MKVKPEVLRGSNVDLRCVFDSDGDRIYSVKWYKGSHEFFRYLPEGPVRFQIFSWSNFTIDVSTVNNFFFVEISCPSLWPSGGRNRSVDFERVLWLPLKNGKKWRRVCVRTEGAFFF